MDASPSITQAADGRRVRAPMGPAGAKTGEMILVDKTGFAIRGALEVH